MRDGPVAALDIGKTHSRLTLIDPETGHELWCARCPSRSKATSCGLQLDVSGVEQWLIEALRNASAKYGIACIVPIAHGAAAVLLDEQGNVLIAPDYEDARFSAASEAYEPLRDPFESTFSPSLPLGLNVGRQLFYLANHEPALFSRMASIVLYPQFWAWRLSGMLASEVTSLGCHSDLWLPRERSFSNLAVSQGWDGCFPPLQFAGQVLGNAIGPIATAAGLSPECQVVCGIHDSNASFLRHLAQRRDRRFAMLSSGTWTVAMANQGRFDGLLPGHDRLANVDAFGRCVPTARFMGGREYEIIAQTSDPPTRDAVIRVIRGGIMALPSFALAGPFARSTGRVLGAFGLRDAERASLATLYVALMSDYQLDALIGDDDVVIDGPLAANPMFAAVLAGLRPQRKVLVDRSASLAIAACYVAGRMQDAPLRVDTVEPWEPGLLERYRNRWRDLIASDLK